MNRIREFRERVGLTQDQLADLADTTFQQISRLEKGNRKLNVQWMERLAPHLACKPQDLMTSGLERPINPPSVGDTLSDSLEVAIIGFWRQMDNSQKALILRMMAPPGVTIPAALTSRATKRKRT